MSFVTMPAAGGKTDAGYRPGSISRTLSTATIGQIPNCLTRNMGIGDGWTNGVLRAQVNWRHALSEMPTRQLPSAGGLLHFHRPFIMALEDVRRPSLPNRIGAPVVLTESEVSRSWVKLFKPGEISEASFERAEALLDELRPTSPLRHRLMSELEELRQLHPANVQA